MEDKAKSRARFYALEATAESRGDERWAVDMEYRRMVEAWAYQMEKAFEKGYRQGLVDGDAEAKTVRKAVEE